jgi:hypothetical protein
MGLSVINTIRRNHGLEHATVTGLLEMGVRPPIAGISFPAGFLVFGKASTEQIEWASQEALSRLQAGRADLAVSQYCGTNLVVGALAAALVSALIVRRSKHRFRRIPAAAAGILGANLLARPLGTLVQRYVTTSGEAQGALVISVRRLRIGPVGFHFVRTVHSPS